MQKKLLSRKKILATTPISILLMSFILVSEAAGDVAIVVNKASPLSSITKKQAQKLWLGKIKSVGGSGKLEVIDLTSGSSAYSEFYKKIIKKNAKQLKVYWRKKAFSGKNFPPKTKDSDGEIKEWVASKSVGIGYIDGGSVDGSVKVVLTVK